jgi:hypothetical protein
VKYLRLVLIAILTVVGASTAFAQHSHAGGGPPSGMGPSGSHGPGMGNGNGNGSGNGNASSGGHADMMNASPSDVLSHNTAIAGKIKTLTGQDASTACGGFKNLGQCVAAAHVAKNLNITGGFDALKTTMTSGSGMSLGKAIEQLAPSANAKSESKKANKQAQQDLNESAS